MLMCPHTINNTQTLRSAVNTFRICNWTPSIPQNLPPCRVPCVPSLTNPKKIFSEFHIFQESLNINLMHPSQSH